MIIARMYEKIKAVGRKNNASDSLLICSRRVHEMISVINLCKSCVGFSFSQTDQIYELINQCCRQHGDNAERNTIPCECFSKGVPSGQGNLIQQTAAASGEKCDGRMNQYCVIWKKREYKDNVPDSVFVFHKRTLHSVRYPDWYFLSISYHGFFCKTRCYPSLSAVTYVTGCF